MSLLREVLSALRQAASSLKALVSTRTESRFRRNILSVVKANILVQMLVLATTPLLTHLYSPADFGTVVLFTSLLSFMLAFSTLRFDWSIPNTTSNTQAAALLLLGFISLLIMSTAIFIVLWCWGMSWSFWQGFGILGSLLLLIPVALIGSGLQQLMQFWFVKEASLRAVSRAKVVQRVTGTSLNIAGGFAGLGALGLIVSILVSTWVGVGTLLRNAHGMVKSLGTLSLKSLRLNGRKFVRESAISSVVSLINAASLSITPILFTQYFSTTEVGWYALMIRLANSPIFLFTGAIGQSFWAEAAILIKTDRNALRQLYLKSTRRLSLATIPVVAVCLTAPLYVGFIFGSQWENAGFVLAALSPLLIGQIIVSPLSHLIVHRKQHWQLVWDVCRLIMLITLIGVCVEYGLTITQTVLITSSMMLGMYLILFWMNIANLAKQT